MGTHSIINLEFLQGLVQDAEPNVVLDAFEMEAGSGRGDNYTAMLYRVSLRGRRHTQDDNEVDDDDGKGRSGGAWERSLICKVLPSSARRREAYKSDALFRNEVAFYTRALPALLQFQKQADKATAKAAAPFTATPRCYRAQDNVIVLEDLRTRGFIMADRRQGLDVAHLEAILSEVARFHALSLAMKALEPDAFAREVSGTVRETQFLAVNENWYRDYYRTANNNAVDMVGQGIPDGAERAYCVAAASAFLLDDEDLDEDDDRKSTFFKRMVKLVEPVEPLAVLCHGDCWTNNFLFRYDESSGEIQEVMLVDFQMSRYGSPCLDLVLLLYCCTERSLRQTHLHQLLRHYHAVLVRSLQEMGVDDQASAPYASPDVLWDMIANDMRRLGRFGLGQAVDYVPCLCCDSEEAPNVYDVPGDASGEVAEQGASVPSVMPSAPVTASASERCTKRIADLVQELVTKGDL